MVGGSGGTTSGLEACIASATCGCPGGMVGGSGGTTSGLANARLEPVASTAEIKTRRNLNAWEIM
jgi:hypothetical protein